VFNITIAEHASVMGSNSVISVFVQNANEGSHIHFQARIQRKKIEGWGGSNVCDKSYFGSIVIVILGSEELLKKLRNNMSCWDGPYSHFLFIFYYFMMTRNIDV